MSNESLTKIENESEWDTYWASLDSRRSMFSLLSVATRRVIFQPAVAFYAKRFFSESGVFVEAGCAVLSHGCVRAEHEN